LPILLEEARRMGIRLDPPHINRSQAGFSVRDGTIVFGLAAVRNVGVAAIDRILKIREERDFATLYDFLSRIVVRTVNRRVLESLAGAGAFDEFGRHRAEVYEAIPALLEDGNRLRLERELGQTSLFGSEQETASARIARVCRRPSRGPHRICSRWRRTSSASTTPAIRCRNGAWKSGPSRPRAARSSPRSPTARRS
jgi:DNA polymerase III alpha subunit